MNKVRRGVADLHINAAEHTLPMTLRGQNNALCLSMRDLFVSRPMALPLVSRQEAYDSKLTGVLLVNSNAMTCGYKTTARTSTSQDPQ